MKKLLITLVLVGFSFSSYSQTLIQTFTDRCTGVTQVFQISMTGTTTVVFYDRAKTFTAADVQSGVFQAWLEETYLWWSQLNPCSANQATATTAQQTTQQTTSAATEAATSAASSAATTAPPTTETTSAPVTNDTSTQATSPDTSTSDSGSTSTDATSTDSSSTDSTQSTETDSSSSDSTGESGGSTEDSSEGSTEETSSEETSSEESSDSESEESVEEESSEESSEEESESEEESSDSEDSEDSEEDEKKEKKKNLAPPILASNLASMQMLDGTWSTAASFGLSQSSLTGQETYSANLMLWSNFKQFSLGVGKSKLHFWSEYEDIAYIVSQSGKRTPAINFHTKERYVDRQNKIHHISSFSANYMYLYGTSVITAGYSAVYLGQKEDFFQGFAGGFAATNSIIILPESTLYSPALTLFGTKPLNFKALPRWSFAPMLAISLTPLQIINSKNEFNKNQAQFVWNEYFTYIIGNNINFNLTQRFTANLGINTINNTNPIVPTTFAITIGARFAF